MNHALPPSGAPIVFLAGPPGSGKSALGSRACAELGLRFVDLDDDGRTDEALQELVRTRAADVVTVPWAPTRDAGWLGLCRRSGETLGLWAHPLDMQARSGRAEPLFKPVKGRKTRGGFGRNGIGCREFRHLRRACPNVLSLVGLPEEEAGELLREALEDLRSPKALSPAEAEGLLGWCDDWRHDFSANAKACTILVDAMARFTMQLKAQGTSPRTMSGVYGDLNAAGFLVMCYDAPKGEKVLDSFRCDPSGYEYSRQISDSPRAMQRFASTWRAFAGFLRESQDRREEPGDVTAKTG